MATTRTNTQARTLNEKATNANILNAIREEASPTYQERIPAADQGDIASTIKAMDSYRPAWNEFANALVNRIGMVVMQGQTWSNPLKSLKRGMMEYGDTVEEYRTNLIQAHRYDPNECHEDIFSCAPVETASAFHDINRQDYYKLTVNEMLVRRAMLNEYGLQEYVNSVMEAPYISDELDEYLIMKNLFRLYDQEQGYFKVQVPAVENKLDKASIEAQALYIAQIIDEYKYNFDFMKSDYNGLHWPTSSRGHKIIVFAEPHLASVLDTYVIPYAFRDTNAIRLEIIPIDDFGIEGCQAIMCDERHIFCWDTYMAFKSIENPQGRSWNYWWHHDGIYSLSKFVNAVMFTTNAGTPQVKPTFDVTGVAVEADGGAATVKPGGELRLKATVTGTVTPENSMEIPQGVMWSISATGGKPLADRTYIDAEGMLHVGEGETNAKLTVTATSVYPSKAEATKGQYITGTIDVVVEVPAADPAE